MKAGKLIGPILALTAIAAAGYLLWREYRQPAAVNTPPPVVVSEPEPPSQPQYPVPVPDATGESEPPLPALADSDGEAADSLAALLGRDRLPDLLLSEHLIERIVLTVDTLPTRRVPVRAWPLQPAAGRLAISTGPTGEILLDPANHRRYDAYIALLDGLDLDRLVDRYRRAYPLFQQAYRELGYPEGHFNDRLIAVIDHLMAAPEPGPPIVLVPEKGGYRYADPELASRSAGHALMIRIGPEHARRIKTVLTAIRARLVALASDPAITAPATQAPDDVGTDDLGTDGGESNQPAVPDGPASD